MWPRSWPRLRTGDRNCCRDVDEVVAKADFMVDEVKAEMASTAAEVFAEAATMATEVVAEAASTARDHGKGYVHSD